MLLKEFPDKRCGIKGLGVWPRHSMIQNNRATWPIMAVARKHNHGNSGLATTVQIESCSNLFLAHSAPPGMRLPADRLIGDAMHLLVQVYPFIDLLLNRRFAPILFCPDKNRPPASGLSGSESPVMNMMGIARLPV